MAKMTLGEFKARYGEHRAMAAPAVIVDDEATGKKRMIHDATHATTGSSVVTRSGPWGFGDGVLHLEARTLSGYLTPCVDG